MRSTNVVAIILLFALLFTTNVFADEVASSSGTVITTSKSSLTLTPLESFTSEGGLKSAGRTAEIAVGELIADLRTLTKEQSALVKEIAAFNVIKEAAQNEIDAIKKRYDKQKDEYDIMLAPLTADILAFNARPQGLRDDATHSQLAKRKAVSDKEQARLEVERIGGDEAIREIVARVEAMVTPLQSKVANWDNVKLPRMGLAYRQLKVVVEYAKQVNKILLERYPTKPTKWQPEGKHPGYNPDGKYPVLDMAMEQIKALSARGFDTN